MRSKYRIGDVVCHKKQGYIGVIIDVDAGFLPRGAQTAFATDSLRQEVPWYRILVDNTGYTSYVKESLLLKEDESLMIEHPDIRQHLKRQDGRYVAQWVVN